ncbi:MAG: ribonuclease HI [Chitinophagaceae bacterium]|nr:ribonuclease HI [Chitinophagaceae bacterium]
MEVVIYTDGSSVGNPGPGGYGTILLYNHHRKELSESYRFTTNNRMELLAVIKGLEALKQKNLNVLIYSDSQYVVNTVEKKWLDNWVSKNFKGKKNKDLWERYIVAAQNQNITFRWIKGHNGNTENERCDFLATYRPKERPLLVDEAFENMQSLSNEIK